jgi:uncharacterized protein
MTHQAITILAMRSPTVIDAVRAALADHPSLELVMLFGSVARGAERPDSDVDIAVQAAVPLTAAQKMVLVGDLAQATGRAVDLVDLRVVGEPLLGQILAHGKRLHGSDEAYAALLSKHLLDAADFLPYAQRIVDERRRAWIGR